ncbi:MAG: proprotein convertase P-domain-containing protein, partial [Bacteroidota bacterium]
MDTINLAAMINQVDSLTEVSVFPVEGSFQADGIRSDSLPLPDGTGASYETSISFTGFAPGQVLTNINDLLGICVEIEHSYLRDLEIMLTCPDGTTITLHDFAGQTGGEVFLGEPFEADEFGDPVPGVGYEYCWTPDATAGTWIEYSNTNNPGTLPAGDYNSADPLTNLLGCPLNGEWTISVQDLWGVDNGFIFSWSINFNPDLFPDLETFTPTLIDWSWQNQPTIFYQDMDSIAAAPVNAGIANYIFEVTNDFGCTYDTTVTVDVLPPTHPDCYNCQDILTPEQDTAICGGDPVLLDVASNLGPTVVPFETFPSFEIGFSNSPPNAPYTSTIPINSINPGVITDPITDIVSVCFDLETNFLGDIKVFLRGPNGNLLELTTDNGGTSDFYTNTCFTPTAVTPITAGTTPFTGDFQPEGNWNDLIGEPINGDWTLIVSDDAGITTFGSFNAWSITFNSVNDVSYLWTPFTGLSCNNCPNPTASPTVSTTYVVDAVDAY